jgi:hypothetical protein
MHADSCHRNVRLLGSLCLLIGVSILLAPGRIQAAPIHLVLESDEDRPAGQEVFLASYDTLEDFIAGAFASIGFTAIDIAADFSIAGFTFSDTGYHLLLESDEDRPAGQEVFLASFDTLGNFIAADFASIGFTAIDIAADFSIAGFTFSDTGYHLLLESDEDRPAGQEVFLASFDTLGNFIAADFASIGFTAIDIAADFSIAGFTFSDTGYHLLLESDEDRPAGQEVFLASFDTLGNFIAADFAMDTPRPPTTVRARGRMISAPSPMPMASGVMPSTVVEVVMRMGAGARCRPRRWRRRATGHVRAGRSRCTPPAGWRC